MGETIKTGGAGEKGSLFPWVPKLKHVVRKLVSRALCTRAHPFLEPCALSPLVLPHLERIASSHPSCREECGAYPPEAASVQKTSLSFPRQAPLGVSAVEEPALERQPAWSVNINSVSPRAFPQRSVPSRPRAEAPPGAHRREAPAPAPLSRGSHPTTRCPHLFL